VYNRQCVNAISAIDRPDLSFRINLVFLSFNLVANGLLIALFGWYGAAAATLLPAALSLALSSAVLWRVVDGLPVPTRTIGAEVASATVMGLAILALKTVAPSGPAAAVALVGVGAVVYGVTLYSVSERFRRKVTGLLPDQTT
jgi:O-antigen/teichoic acid export membrane protein